MLGIGFVVMLFLLIIKVVCEEADIAGEKSKIIRNTNLAIKYLEADGYTVEIVKNPYSASIHNYLKITSSNSHVRISDLIEKYSIVGFRERDGNVYVNVGWLNPKLKSK